MKATMVRANLLRWAGGATAVVGTMVIAFGSLAVPAAAGGNPNFEGILDASPPTGFLVSPNAYQMSGGSVTVDFDVVVRNLTSKSHKVALNLSADHILTYHGVNVENGQPGQAGITFSGPGGTTQEAMPGAQSFMATWGAKQTLTLDRTLSLGQCGYFQVDIWAPVSHPTPGQRHRATLASGFIRVLGCAGVGAGSPTPTPAGGVGASSPTPTPAGGVGAASATPSPSGSVSASSGSPSGGVLAASTPATGASSPDPWLWIGLVMLTAGVLLVGAGRALRRRA
jgi:hypothetical protein